jgi:hypothetical protein
VKYPPAILVGWACHQGRSGWQSHGEVAQWAL